MIIDTMTAKTPAGTTDVPRSGVGLYTPDTASLVLEDEGTNATVVAGSLGDLRLAEPAT